ncbi:MAG: eight-cysteine-cluster domain-containing protein [Candidatus Bilamarchaeaceae archaeon]
MKKLFLFFVLSVFLFGCISLPTKEDGIDNNTINDNSTIANPASEYCIKNGGKILILVDAVPGQVGVCEFKNQAKCEEWAYLRGECSPDKPNYCVGDNDCACGTHITTGECFVGSKEFVNTEKQCPDYCTGIANNLETRCINFQCKIVGKNITKPPAEGFCGYSTNGKCNNDNDCIRGGCSAQVCQSKNEPPVITTCEYRECYKASDYGLECGCVHNQCRWH